MNPIDMQGKTSFTCTCVHGGGGHMPACDFFVPTRESYLEACAERDKLRKVARAADAFLTAYDTTGGLARTQEEAQALDNALDTLNVNDGVTATLVRPWWFKYA